MSWRSAEKGIQGTRVGKRKKVSHQQHDLFADYEVVDSGTTLNSEQMRVVEWRSGPLAVAAGPGSGKTRVITEWVKRAVLSGRVEPSELLVSTFTKKAAKEVETRLRKANVKTDNMSLRTLHSFANSVLKQAITHGASPKVDEHGGKYKRAIAVACRSVDESLKPERAARFISMAKAMFVFPDDDDERHKAVFDKMRDPFDDRFVDVFHLAEEIRKEEGYITFDDQITEAVLLLQRDSLLLESYQEMIKYVIVDEFQDTNLAQLHLIDLVAAPQMNLIVVGDEDQSIYGFRGAEPGYLTNFRSRYEGAELLTMGTNYRCPSPVISAAKTLISNNSERTEKMLVAGKDEKATRCRIEAVRLPDQWYEARYVAERIIEEKESGRPYSDMTILYRMHSQINNIEEELIDRSIPYTIVAGKHFYERPDIIGLLSYVRLLANPLDAVQGRIAIKHPFRRIGKKDLDRIDTICSTRNTPYHLAAKIVSGSKKLQVFAFYKLICSLGDEQYPADVINAVIEKTGFAKRGESEGDEDTHLLVRELISIASRFRSINDFLEHVEKDSKKRKKARRKKKNAVQCMTIHASKGIESPVIFLAGANKGAFPSKKAYEEGRIDEERSLFYVAITRTKESLYISSYRGEMKSPPSPFIQEADLCLDCDGEERFEIEQAHQYDW